MEYTVWLVVWNMFYLFQISIGEFQRVEDYLKSQLGVPTTVAKTLENLRGI